ncbi:MAG: hypothetical protein WA771_14670 [Chthoniobacterales bacterium]
MISSEEALGEFVEGLKAHPVVALDTEADSLHCYFEKLCLIQVSTADGHDLVDPLADVSLQQFFDVFTDRRVIFHGADYDLRMLRKSGTFEPGEIFDTMIAARLCGFDALGYSALVERYFSVKLSKSSQKANWAIRPLPDQMVEYAMNDTRYLLKICEELESEIRRLDRWEWFRESIERVNIASREIKERDEDMVWRISGSARLSARAQSVLRVLWFWRDAESRAWDRPPFHVMGNNDLLTVSEKVSRGEAFSTPRLTNKRRRSFDVALALALQVPESEWPKPVRKRGRRRTQEQLDRFDELKVVRDRAAGNLNLDPSIIASRGALEAVSVAEDSDALMSWQRELIGLAARNGAPANGESSSDSAR